MASAEENRLVVENMGLVATIASDFRGRGVDFEDLLAIGREGLSNAARKYEPGRVKFATFASGEIRSLIKNELISGRHHLDSAKALPWGDEHSERIYEWKSWGANGNAMAIYEIWSDGFDPAPDDLSALFDEIRGKQDRFNAAFISLKPNERKIVTLVYLRDPAMSIERAAREMRISYLKGWRTLKRALEKMREVISAMEMNKKPVLEPA